MMRNFIAEKPSLWNEDIGEAPLEKIAVEGMTVEGMTGIEPA